MSIRSRTSASMSLKGNISCRSAMRGSGLPLGIRFLRPVKFLIPTLILDNLANNRHVILNMRSSNRITAEDSGFPFQVARPAATCSENDTFVYSDHRFSGGILSDRARFPKDSQANALGASQVVMVGDVSRSNSGTHLPEGAGSGLSIEARTKNES